MDLTIIKKKKLKKWIIDSGIIIGMWLNYCACNKTKRDLIGNAIGVVDKRRNCGLDNK